MSHRCKPDGSKKKRHRPKKGPSHERMRGALLKAEADLRALTESEQKVIKRLRKDDQSTTESAMYWADGEAWEEIE